MQLTVSEAARLLQVAEETVYKWILESKLPAVKFNEQYRLNKVELAEWAQSNQMPLLEGSAQASGSHPPILAAALAEGGIHHSVRGATKKEVLQSIVRLLRLPEGEDREFVLQMLLAREEQCSTGFGDGIAIPHARMPIVLHTNSPSVTLAFLETPIDFGALDGKPVFALFTMVNPTVRIHLQLISRLSHALRAPGFLQMIRSRAGSDEIIREAAAVEEQLEKTLRRPR